MLFFSVLILFFLVVERLNDNIFYQNRNDLRPKKWGQKEYEKVVEKMGKS
jgi:hypothetical protein